jgi:hypothetical protein
LTIPRSRRAWRIADAITLFRTVAMRERGDHRHTARGDHRHTRASRATTHPSEISRARGDTTFSGVSFTLMSQNF